MRRDVITFHETTSCREVLEKFPPGSIKWIALLDDGNRYAGLCDVPEISFVAKPEQPVSTFARQKAEILTLGQSLEDALTWFEFPGREAVVVVSSVAMMDVVGILTEAYVLKRYAQELERRRLH